MVFGKKDRTVENDNFSKQYCKGFNVGTSLLKAISPKQREQTKELLHLMILAKPKDISYHATLAGFCYEIELQKNKERSAKRMAEIEKINEKTKNREQERGR